MEDVIFTRASIREFTDKPVSEEQIDRLMKAAMAAPSAGNQQPWEFYLTRDADTKQRLSECSPFAKPACKADLVIIPCMRCIDLKFPPYAPLDMSACVENILLEAEELGLGAVWLGIYPEDSRVEKVFEVISAPEGTRPFALIAVGHPAERITPRSKKRMDLNRVHWI